jgi:hypothetical protein
MKGRGKVLARRLVVALGLLLLAGSFASASAAVAANGTAEITIEGSGAGEVISAPGGFAGNPPIACDYESPGPATGVCETELSQEGIFGVFLEAKPDPGSVFAGWVVEGAAIQVGCGEELTCGVANEAEETQILVKATFESEPVPPNGTAEITIEGSGAGEVISAPGGFEGNPPIACDYESPGPATGVCETELSQEGIFGVFLEAKPDPGSVFAGWVVEGAAIQVGCGEELTCGVANEAEETQILVKATFESAPPPTISGLAPSEGPTAGGNLVTITGTNLSRVEAVEFGGAAANLASLVEVSPTEIEIEAPAHAAGTVDVFVTTGGGASTNTAADDYTYVAAPAITGLSPSKGPTAGGTVVTITGTDLVNVDAVEFGSVPVNLASLEEISPTEIKVKTPVHLAGTVSVVVVTPGGPSADTAADDFTYVAQPAVTGLSPNSGPASGGNEVEIRGLRLSGATKVEFGTTVVGATEFIESTETKIKLKAPAHVAGTVNVRVTTPGGISAGNFTNDDYTFLGPVVLTISKAGTGSGTVTCDGGACASSYAFGSKVTLAAAASSGSTFAGWSGACSGLGVCVLTMTANTTVTAAFNANSAPPLCVVPKLKGMALGKAKSTLKKAHCTMGKVTKPRRKKGKRPGPLVVKSSNPEAETALPADSKVDLRLRHKSRTRKSG